MKKFFRQPLDDVMAALERLADSKRPGPMLAGMVFVGAVAWFIYVPIHELLHAAGCMLTGGDVTTLEIQRRYGGAILAKYFSFVITGGDYAGRLSGFDTKGSDLCYLATDFGPFLLTVLIGVPLLKLAARRRRPLLFPVAVVVGLAPFYNMPGDYFEMGSIMTTRTATVVFGLPGASAGLIQSDETLTPVEAPPKQSTESPFGGQPARYGSLRADNVFKLFEEFFTKPSMLGIAGTTMWIGGLLVILVSLILDVLLAFMTYGLGHWFSKLVVR